MKEQGITHRYLIPNKATFFIYKKFLLWAFKLRVTLLETQWDVCCKVVKIQSEDNSPIKPTESRILKAIHFVAAHKWVKAYPLTITRNLWSKYISNTTLDTHKYTCTFNLWRVSKPSILLFDLQERCLYGLTMQVVSQIQPLLWWSQKCIIQYIK